MNESSSSHIAVTDAVTADVDNCLACNSTDTTSFAAIPRLAAAFRKQNAALSSSAAVERLFDTAGRSLMHSSKMQDVKHSVWTACLFEIQTERIEFSLLTNSSISIYLLKGLLTYLLTFSCGQLNCQWKPWYCQIDDTLKYMLLCWPFDHSLRC